LIPLSEVVESEVLFNSMLNDPSLSQHSDLLMKLQRGIEARGLEPLSRRQKMLFEFNVARIEGWTGIPASLTSSSETAGILIMIVREEAPLHVTDEGSAVP
jgi:hypothetical protein